MGRSLVVILRDVDFFAISGNRYLVRALTLAATIMVYCLVSDHFWFWLWSPSSPRDEFEAMVFEFEAGDRLRDRLIFETVGFAVMASPICLKLKYSKILIVGLTIFIVPINIMLTGILLSFIGDFFRGLSWWNIIN